MERGMVAVIPEPLKEVVVRRIPHLLVFDDLMDQSKNRTGQGIAHRAVPCECKQLSTYIVRSRAAGSRFFWYDATEPGAEEPAKGSADGLLVPARRLLAIRIEVSALRTRI
jgi:hypothetical protein